MANILRIYNVSEYLYKGGYVNIVKNNSSSYNKYANAKPKVYFGPVARNIDGSYQQVRLPVGGFSYLLTPIFESLSRMESDPYLHETLVFCCDVGQYIKYSAFRECFPWLNGYKGNRPKTDPRIAIQKKMAVDVLSLFTDNVFYGEGFEADDYIYTIANKYSSYYDKVIIHTLDKDLYILVKDNIEIGGVGDNSKIFNRGNYELVTGLPYSTHLFYKLRDGDSSDSIPHLHSDAWYSLEKAITPSAFPALTNIPLFRDAVASVLNNDKFSLDVFDMMVPYTVPFDNLTISEEPINTRNLFYIGKLVSNKFINKIANMIHSVDEVAVLFDEWATKYHNETGGF